MQTQWLSYGVALLTVALALGLTLLFRLYVEPVDLALFYAAVAVSAWWGGIRAGVLATVLSTLAIVYFSVPPVYAPSVSHSGELFSVGAFVLVTLLIGSLNSELTLAKRWARTHLRAAADTLRESEAQLRHSNERFELAAAAVNCLIYDWTAETKAVERTEGLTRLFGYSLADAEPTRSWWEALIHPDDLPSLLEQRRAILSQSDRFACEYRVRHQDGHYLHVLDQGIVVRDATGQPSRVVGSIIDISERQAALRERKQAAQRLEQANQTLRTLIDACPLAITFFDAQGVVKLWNRGAEQIFGWTAEEAVGRFLPSAPQHRQDFLDNLTAVLNGKPLVGIEARRRRKDGQPIDIAIWATLIQDAEGEPGCLTIVADISDRKRAEAALRQSEAQFRQLADAMPQIVWISKPDGHPQYVSQRWIDYTGLTLEQTDDRNALVEIVHPEDLQATYERWKTCLATVSLYETEFRLKRAADRLYHWFLCRAVPIRDEQGRVLCWYGTLTDIDDLKRAEVELHRREREFRTLAENFPDIVARFDRQLRHLYINPGIEAALGIPPERFIGKTNLELGFTDAPSQAWNQAILQVFSSGQSTCFELQYPSPTQGMRSYQARLVPESPAAVEAGAEVETVLAIISDVTDAKRAELAMRESETRYRTLANAIPLLVWVNTADGRIEYYNDRWQAYIGLEPIPNQGVDWQAIIHPDDLQRVLDTRQRGLEAGEPYEMECRIRRISDQSYRWHLTRVVPLKDDQARVLRWFGTAADIDSIKQMEAGQRFLAEASSVLAASLDGQTMLNRLAQLAVPFLADYCFFDVITADNAIERVAWQYANPAKQGWFNQVQSLMPAPTFEQHPLAQAIASGQSIWVAEVTEEWLRSSTNSPEQLQFMHECQLQSLIAVPLIAHQRRLGILTFCCNTESHRRYTPADLALAQELAQRAALALDNARLYQQAQDANRMKDQFLAILSHELRSPLNPILGWAKLLQARSYEPAVLMQGLQTIERNAKLQTQLIEDLLDISRILRGKLSLTTSTVDLQAVVEAAIETVRLAAEAKAIALQFTVASPDAGSARSPDSPAFRVVGDANRLQQVVWNLLANAIKFTPAGGCVQIQLQQVEAAVSSVSPRPGCYAQLRITDTGKGIKPEFLPYIFDYFRQEDGATTRKFGGLGLGLAIVRHLVELHGGTVEAASPGEDQGATFTVRLALQPPLADDRQAQSTAQPSLASTHPLRAIRILVVDDEPDARKLLVFLLEQAGAITKSVGSAAEALQALQESMFDLLISDIGMPITDGYSLVQQIRTRLPDRQRQMPAIALTAYAGELNQQQALAAGFQQHLAKPVEPDGLIQAILALTNRAPG